MQKNTQAPGFTIPDIEDITRRDFLVGGAAALLLGGCGGSGGNEASGETKTVEHAGGSSEIPVRPERIVTLYTDAWGWPVAQLGGSLIGTASNPDSIDQIRRDDPYSARILDEAESIGASGEPNLERIAALEPDLILGGWYDTQPYEELSRIAPTVLLDYREESDLIVWQRSLMDIVGSTETDWFEERVTEYERRIETLRDEYTELWGNLEWLRMDTFEQYVYVVDLIPMLPGAKVFNDLGAQRSNTIDPDDPRFDEAVSLETLPTFDADIIFVAATDGNAPPTVMELLQGTFAGRRDQVFEIVNSRWNFCNVQSLHLVLDDIESALANGTFDTSGDFR